MDDADRASESRKFACGSCDATFEHMYPEVAVALLKSHKERKHKES